MTLLYVYRGERKKDFVEESRTSNRTCTEVSFGSRVELEFFSKGFPTVCFLCLYFSNELESYYLCFQFKDGYQDVKEEKRLFQGLISESVSILFTVLYLFLRQ